MSAFDRDNSNIINPIVVLFLGLLITFVFIFMQTRRF
jgi:hypothetical protein